MWEVSVNKIKASKGLNFPDRLFLWILFEIWCMLEQMRMKSIMAACVIEHIKEPSDVENGLKIAKEAAKYLFEHIVET